MGACCEQGRLSVPSSSSLHLSLPSPPHGPPSTQAVLQADPKQLSMTLQRSPALLLQAPARLAELTADAAMLLSVSEAQVVDMARR